jgi:hypothetical protein
MAKKTDKEEVKTKAPVEEGTPFDGEGINIDTDFDVEDEFRPDPLIPQGTYHASVTNVTFDGEQQAIVWKFCLHDNGGVMSDGETPVDGAVSLYRNWLPRPGDEGELNSSGRATKRQSKINMLKQFSSNIGVDMSTPQVIIAALQNQEWIGLEVDIQVTTREYEGKIFNDIRRVSKSSMMK